MSLESDNFNLRLARNTSEVTNQPPSLLITIKILLQLSQAFDYFDITHYVPFYFLFCFSCVVYVAESVDSLKNHVDTCAEPVCNNDEILCPGKMICEPEQLEVFTIIELVCVCFFLADYASRILTCWALPPRLCGISSALLTEEDEAILVAIEQPPKYFVEDEVLKRLKVNMFSSLASHLSPLLSIPTFNLSSSAFRLSPLNKPLVLNFL